MTESSIQVYSYRWIVLLLFMFINMTLQMLWISFASVTVEAATYYNVAEFDILLLSMIFMIAYIPVTFLASWVIDTYDFKIGAGIGALLAGTFGFLRFFSFSSYTLVFIFQLGIAVGQPFVLNSITKMSANWFPETERTTATGIGLLSQFIGIMLGLLLTPFIVLGVNFEAMLLTYGLLGLAAGILFIVFAKNTPPTPPSSKPSKEKVMMVEGLRELFKNKYFLILLVTFFVGLGIFNMITTYIQLIVLPKSPEFDATFAGILGALMLIGGIVGCVIMPGLSDKYQKRRIFLIISLLIATVALLLISISNDAGILLFAGFLFGFGLLSAAPVALEYAVEVTHPIPEATSNGSLMMIGQVGGILFILGLEGFTTPSGDYFPALILQTILLAIVLVITILLLKEEK
ncbi:MAG: MFS transporter [Promethearchaeota archaeon]